MNISDLIMVGSVISGIYFVLKNKPKYYYISLVTFLFILILKLMKVIA